MTDAKAELTQMFDRNIESPLEKINIQIKCTQNVISQTHVHHFIDSFISIIQYFHSIFFSKLLNTLLIFLQDISRGRTYQDV